MNSQFSITFFALIIATTLLHIQITPATATTSSFAEDTEFIRTNCKSTIWPDLCFHLLSRHANQIHQDSAKLARVAIAVSLPKVKRMLNYVNHLSRDVGNGANRYTVASLKQCSEVFDLAVDDIRDSLNEMRYLGGTPTRESLYDHLSNVQTWMSGAATDVDTCVDGFEEGGTEAAIKSDVVGRTKAVEKVISVALQLICSYANQVTPP